jgi:hypothetical protein
MSRIFSDENLLSWEAYASGGRFGLPENPKIVFHCLSNPDRIARFVDFDGDNASAQGAVQELDEDELRDMLREASELP